MKQLFQYMTAFVLLFTASAAPVFAEQNCKWTWRRRLECFW